MKKNEEQVFGSLSGLAKSLIGLMVIISIVIGVYFTKLIVDSANKEILIVPQINVVRPLLKEFEEEVKKNSGKIPSELKTNKILEKNENGEILISGYKNSVIYLNTTKERENFYLDKNLLILKPIVTGDKVIWSCYFVQAGKIVDNNEFNCVKTSETAQKRRFNKNKIDLAPELWNDREILKKFYMKQDGKVPIELENKIKEEKQFIEKYSKKSI